MTTEPHRRVLLIGASRGLGLALAQQYLARGSTVVATVRGSGPTALHQVVPGTEGRLTIETVDITEADQVDALRTRLAAQRFDLLLVNAGVTDDESDTVATVSTSEFVRLMVTNALSPMRLVEAFQDLVEPGGTIAIMSSGQGSVANNERGGFEIYRASKAALNQLMRSYAARHRGEPRTLLLLAPGWVRTDLGGPAAPLTIEESIPNLVEAVAAQHAHGGLQYLDYLGRTVRW
ncbi:MAG: 3-oxoacyl-ACP reductase [Cellulomonas sp. 73-145]|uniref:SDR family NAD(P)-dependent oxidoreductase n=1 Tax=Cellulomonas sp. 73-145 TaxID=1895739 RepID=UPI00092655EB|nr:SDR family NAD(P)-dependent oxidoreductase [Cellulomonas sp. 73-145]MBN9326666.1 SDR family NAD(P)-dependent oxidoreductase [Cellulomonas sp.]OJV61031.1 MAG: 3-oxoacyl-ACP reductase [Cellulomonas sp. 73-145]